MSFISDHSMAAFDVLKQDVADTLMPIGWRDTIWAFAKKAMARLNVSPSRIVLHAENGLLRITARSSDPLDTDIMKQVSQYIARQSARTCMVCGKFGYRRKMESGWPCLCRDHYILYANALHEERLAVQKDWEDDL